MDFVVGCYFNCSVVVVDDFEVDLLAGFFFLVKFIDLIDDF